MIAVDSDSIYLVDKPLGWTSFDVVKKIRICLNQKKVGHSGTLDPLATGLLVLCTGKKTKEISSIQDMDKEYTGEFTLGQVTPSFDLETQVEFVSDCSHLSEDEILQTAKKLTGEIDQIPPAYSAVKVEGRPAYIAARKGKEQKLRPRKVTIQEFEILKVELPIVEFRITCSKGTYIRSLANDFGKLTGVGAHLSKLIRTRIGNYKLEDANSIEEICKNESL